VLLWQKPVAHTGPSGSSETCRCRLLHDPTGRAKEGRAHADALGGRPGFVNESSRAPARVCTAPLLLASSELILPGFGSLFTTGLPEPILQWFSFRPFEKLHCCPSTLDRTVATAMNGPQFLDPISLIGETA
jgi:hypothetical protein